MPANRSGPEGYRKPETLVGVIPQILDSLFPFFWWHAGLHHQRPSHSINRIHQRIPAQLLSAIDDATKQQRTQQRAWHICSVALCELPYRILRPVCFSCFMHLKAHLCRTVVSYLSARHPLHRRLFRQTMRILYRCLRPAAILHRPKTRTGSPKYPTCRHIPCCEATDP